MVTICTKKFCKPTIQDIILAKIRKKKENEGIEEFFAKLKQQREPSKLRILSGTTVPNSTFKSLHANGEKTQEKNDSVIFVKDNTDVTSEKIKSAGSITSKPSLESSSSLKSLQRSVQEKEDSSASSIKPKEKSRTSSILSGTNTLEELKELRDLLRKSSYVPKQTSTRRPTIEKIKSAIEKEKRTLMDKNESTINDSMELSDASTSTGRKKKKRVKTLKKTSGSLRIARSTSRSIEAGSNAVSDGKKGKRIKRKKKIGSKIDVEVQCSIFKVKINE